MLENPSIAQNYTKQNKATVMAFWNELHVALNSAGPPTKTVFEWKKVLIVNNRVHGLLILYWTFNKVWNDQKRYVRKKCAKNKQESQATGGGPNKTVPLTATEESVLQIIGGNEAVEGLEEGIDFGFVSETTVENLEPDVQSSLPTGPTVSSCSIQNVYTPSPKKKKLEAISSTIEKELENQEKLCKCIDEAVLEIKENNKEVIKIMERIHNALENNNDLKKLELAEQKRHNQVLEEQNAMKIEIKQKLLEIEELKYFETNWM